MEKKPVLVAILSGGVMNHVTQTWLAYNLPILTASPNCPYKFGLYIEAGTSPQEYARNRIIEAFLKSDCEILMMIDDDMTMRPGALDLLSTPEPWDIVAPLQHMFHPVNPDKGKFKPECIPCAFNRDAKAEIGKQLLPVYPMEGDGNVSEVSAVGSGVMAIKRRVLEDPKMMVEEGMEPPAFFLNRYENNGRRIRGLDIDFCWRAGELGYAIRINWGVEVGHYKRVDLWDVDYYAKASFMDGLKAGLRERADGIQVAQGEGREADRKSGVAGHPGGSDLAESGVDRAGTPSADAIVGKVARRATG